MPWIIGLLLVIVFWDIAKWILLSFGALYAIMYCLGTLIDKLKKNMTKMDDNVVPTATIYYTEEDVTVVRPTTVRSVAPPPQFKGGVYLLKAGPHYKIGKAIEFDKRIKQLKIQLPFAVELVHKIYAQNPSAAESHWHRRFADKRVNGEWFTLTEADVSEFKSTSRM